ncbi:putative disease resistance RPP13-like protein 1 [Corylus avellana]|uniref:putative disease resistance RPP13-like protein 1 n=1 Tax=Corylus avellana TaxID=13451 RepID=UPI00286C6A58|nr:putative disease resistance RPP13-like protein 1 [Corylus avellana]
MAELFLSPLIQLLFDQLASGELLNFARRHVGLGEKLNKWKHTLEGIQAVLDDADGKQHDEKQSRAVKLWLDDLRDLAYDVEDILDEFATEALQRKLKGGDDDQASTSKLRKLIPTCCIGLTPSALKLNVSLVSKIEEISARFDEIVERKGRLKLEEAADRGRSNRRRGTLEPTSLMTDAYVFGREKDKEAILQVLLSEKRSDARDKVSVIPILGMGGIGKTTLAKLLFHDEKVQSFFELKAWACVSEDFNVVRVTKAVLKMVTTESCDDDDLNLLQVKLEKNLKGKKFLVVLDDLWNENYDDWTILRAPFLAGAPGSTIVITTRNERVSLTTRSIPEYHYRLEVLSKDACLSVFTQHALGASNFNAHPDLQESGEKIVERCKGLPLAAKTLGGLLRTKKDRNEWENVLKSKIWDIPEERSGIVPALMLSYHHLPPHLKRCFMYCSILPEDCEFKEQQLILLWMAEGLIQPPKEDTQMEDLGSEYFQDLLSRSFFQQSSTKKLRFVMHDLIKDLAQRIAGDICFRMEDEIRGGNRRRFPKKVRHSSYLGDAYDIAKS